MPFRGADDPNLPPHVQARSRPIRLRWVIIFNTMFQSHGEAAAFLAANTWLKNQIEEKRLEARTKQVREVVRFEIDTSKQLIKRTEDGDEYISAVLTTTKTHKDGKKGYSPKLLQKWANWINEGNSIVGDVDHAEFDALLQEGCTDDEVAQRLKDKPGIAKTVKAVYEKGKLWVRLMIDKRYRSLIKKSKGLSLEALTTSDDNGNVIDGDLLGFTFGVNHDPAVPGSVVAS